MTIHLPPRSPSQALETLPPLPGPNGHTSGSDFAGRQEWSALDCLRTLYRRKATLLWITCAGILAAAILSLVQPLSYQSQASLDIQGVNENFLNFRDIYPTAAPGVDAAGTYLLTQAEILQEDALIAQVVSKLHLEGRPEFQRAAHNVVEAVKNNLKIVPTRGSRIVRIVSEARDPQLAADIANTLAATFIEQNIEVRQRAAQQTQEWLSLQLEGLRSKLLQSEAKLGADGHTSGAAYSRLKGEVEANRKSYETMSQRVNDARIASTASWSNIRLVGPAQPPARPYKPNVPLNLAIGVVGGLVLAIGYVMLQEQTNSGLRVPGEAGTYLTLPELGAIPKAASRFSTRRLLSSSNGTFDVERAVLEQRSSGLSESFRTTLASILSASRNSDHPHMFVVTSSRPMEGKTTVVSNLGIALAEISGKVLLIDGDMRRPRLHKVFGQANSWGLSDVLREKNAIEDLPLDALVRKTAVPHLSLLPSGACTDNISGLLYSGRMARLLPRFREEFDYVLVDAPPCLEFADARIMARYAERLLLVVRADHTDKQTAQAAVQRLLLDGIPVMGVILNRWDRARGDVNSYALYYGVNSQDLA